MPLSCERNRGLWPAAGQATHVSVRTPASLIQRLRVAYRFHFDKFYLDDWQSWRDHFSCCSWRHPPGVRATRFHVNNRCDRQLERCLQLIAPGVEKGRKPPNYSSPFYELMFFFRGRGYFKMPHRRIDAAKPMLMRARWRVGASANDDPKTGWNFSSLIGGISRSGSWNWIQGQDLWFMTPLNKIRWNMDHFSRRNAGWRNKSLPNEALTTLFYAVFLLYEKHNK